jgi:predicted small secreted protein
MGEIDLKKTALLAVLLLVSALLLLTACGAGKTAGGEVSQVPPSEAATASQAPSAGMAPAVSEAAASEAPVIEAASDAGQATVALCPAALILPWADPLCWRRILRETRQ